MKEAREKLAFDVFLSHNGKDKRAVRALAALLTEHGLKVWLDEERLIPGHPWQVLLEEGIRISSTGAVLVGSDGLGPWEDEEMRALLQFAATEKKPVIPVLLPGAPEKPDLPLFLSNRTWVDLRDGFGKEGIDKLIWGITGEHPDRRPGPPPRSEPIISVTRLRHGAEHLVGREEELARLDAAWHDPKTHIVTIVAWGGVGKTALVVEWMARMARDGWAGAERVFDWSFYSQSTREQGAPSADAFVAAALEFFGGDEGKRLAASPASPWDKGARLAQAIAQGRTLLVLDGVEPLQYSPGPLGGRLKDPALEAMLKGLAQQNPGLTIVTTREPLENLAFFRDTTSPQWSLEHLSVDAGKELLFQIGVRRAGNAQIRANDKELKDATREVSGHALTLQLLGRYIAKARNGDVRKRSLVRFAKADAKIQGGHAFKVMAAYEKWLAKGGEDSPRQLAILRLLGLFDRPADAGCLIALRQEPTIVGLTEPLVSLSDDDWNYTLSNLVECGLISSSEDQSQTPGRQFRIDCHPLIREYFAKKLSKENPDAWRAAHRRLYEYLRDSTPDKPQPTLDDLQPLYQAVVHGCQADLHQNACDEVFAGRIRRHNEKYSWKKLGAFGADLGAIACFFEQPWVQPSPALAEDTQAWLLNAAAFRLRVLGRSTEAIEPLRAALQMRLRQADSKNIAISANNLSELELTMGEVDSAVRDAEKAVEFADHSGEGWQSVVKRTTLANAMHQAGRRDNALTYFREAEILQAKALPGYPLLYSMAGFRYSDLLLATPEHAAWQRAIDFRPEGCSSETAETILLQFCYEVKRRATTASEWRKLPTWNSTYHSLLDIALDHLALGRAALYRAILEKSEVRSAKPEVDQAVAGLRRAGQQDYIPHGLLTRAWLRFLEDDAASTRADLNEAWEIAERGSMRLHMADIQLHRARLFHDKDALAEARKLIGQCGYHRRDEELADAEAAAKNW